MSPGTKVVIYGEVRGTFIGISEKGMSIIDLGHGTVLVPKEQVVALA